MFLQVLTVNDLVIFFLQNYSNPNTGLNVKITCVHVFMGVYLCTYLKVCVCARE